MENNRVAKSNPFVAALRANLGILFVLVLLIVLLSQHAI